MSLTVDLVYNNIILIIIFFIIYSFLFTINKNNFVGANNYIDILYFTTATQSSIGYGDITPKTSICKLTASFHHLLVIFITANFIVRLSGN